MYIVQTYAAYLLISIALTVWVARTLHKNGRVFLIESFGGQATLADSVNQLLVVGFYLVNFGFAALWLNTGQTMTDFREVLQFLSVKLGTLLLVVGALHLVNLVVFSRIRRNAIMQRTLTEATRPVS